MTDLSPQRRFMPGRLSASAALLAWYGLRASGIVTAGEPVVRLKLPHPSR